MAFWNPFIGGSGNILEITYRDDNNSPPARTNDFNLKTYIDGLPTGIRSKPTPSYSKIIFNVPHDYYFGSTSAGTAAFDVGNFETDQEVVINLDGYIVGRGGAGGSAGTKGPATGPANPGATGGQGGRAFCWPGVNKTTLNVSYLGLLSGGGGGQGGQAGYWIFTPETPPDPEGPQGFYTGYNGKVGGVGAGYCCITSTRPSTGQVIPANLVGVPSPVNWSFQTTPYPGGGGVLGVAGNAGQAIPGNATPTTPLLSCFRSGVAGGVGGAGPYIRTPPSVTSWNDFTLTEVNGGPKYPRIHGSNDNPTGAGPHPFGNRNNPELNTPT